MKLTPESHPYASNVHCDIWPIVIWEIGAAPLIYYYWYFYNNTCQDMIIIYLFLKYNPLLRVQITEMLSNPII